MTLVPDSPRHRNRNRRRNRLLFVVAAALTVVASHLVADTGSASASADDEHAFVVALNQVRADHGLPPFAVNAELTTLARDHARVMADAGEIFHADPISAGYTGEWVKLGENVGVGAGVDVLVDAFVASPGHFANIVDPSFTEIGVGVVWDDGSLYTTHRFLQPPGAAPAPTTAPTTTTAPATTTAPVSVAPSPTEAPAAAPLPDPPITAERVLALLALLDRVGT